MKKSCAVIAIGLAVCTGSFAADPVGKVLSVKGEAHMAHVLKPKIPVTAGAEVFALDKFSTGADGEVVIDMNGESKLTVRPNTSLLKIEKKSTGKEGGTELAVYGGSVGFEVKPLGEAQTFTVRSPSAVAGVRGTVGELSFDMNSGVTGAQSQPHTDGSKEKSIVYTAEPEQKAMLNSAIMDSKKAEQQGGGLKQPDNLLVVNEGQASFHMAGGDALLVKMTPGADLKEMGNKVAQDIKDGKAVTQANSRFARMDAGRIAYLEDLERRLENIDPSRLDLRLPSPGETPKP